VESTNSGLRFTATMIVNGPGLVLFLVELDAIAVGTAVAAFSTRLTTGPDRGAGHAAAAVGDKGARARGRKVRGRSRVISMPVVVRHSPARGNIGPEVARFVDDDIVVKDDAKFANDRLQAGADERVEHEERVGRLSSRGSGRSP